MNVPLELTGLTKVFPTPTGPFVAVKDVNAKIEAGEFVAILGHSGCGKSTVLSILAGLERATARRRHHRRPRSHRARPRTGHRLPVAVPAAVADRAAERRGRRRAGRRRASGRSEALAAADHYLELVGVADVADQLPPQLSLGTQQCVSLARALAVEPRFLLLDEPFSMLDSLTRFELQDILLRVWEAVGQDRRDGDARRRRGALPGRPPDPDDRRPGGHRRRRHARAVSAPAHARRGARRTREYHASPPPA